MLENTNIKQFYPGPILNKTLDITDFLFKDPEQIHITYTYKNEDGSLDNRELTYGTEYEVAKILPSDVTQADAALTASTGRVTLKADINVVLGERLTIYRESEIIQEAQYPRTGPFPAASHEGALDYLTMQNQEQQDQIDRSLKVPISTANFDGALPIPVPARALKINDSGSGFEFSEYDPDTALETTKEYMEGAQTAASNALASQNAAASSASSAANSVTEAGNVVDAGVTTLNNTINTFKTYMNENPYSGKTIGEFFWTFRKDTINGAYECNGQEFAKSLFSGDQNPYDLLVAGKLPVKTYEEYQAEIEAHGVCTYFGLDTTNQKFKVPKIKEIYVQADEISKVGQFVSESLPNINGTLGMASDSTPLSGAFYSYQESSNVNTNNTSAARNTTWGMKFSAKHSSSVYQDNAKVQPNSIKLRPMVQLVTSATEVSFADYEEQFTAALNNAIANLTATGQAYLEDLTPNRFLQFSNRRRIKIKGNTFLRLDCPSQNKTLWYSNLNDIEIEAETLLDEGGTFQNGKAYNLFLVPNANYDGVELKVSLNSTAPTGYTPGDTRRIGGWHTLCVAVGDTSTWAPDHKLNGWLAGDILPQSVWTLYHRPYASPNNTIYIPCGIPFWRTIYDHSGSMLTTNFEYGGTVTRSKSFYGHMIDMMYAGYILPTYEQAAISGFDCEPLKAVMGKAEASVTTAGGHVNESNHRIISSYGAEDCAGCTWKITTIGAIGGSGWNTDPSVGIHQYGSVNVLPVGGYCNNSGNAGPFATNGNLSALTAASNVASFGVSYPLPRKSEGNV